MHACMHTRVYACQEETNTETEKADVNATDCRDLRATFLHAYMKYTNGELLAFDNKVLAMKALKYTV